MRGCSIVMAAGFASILAVGDGFSEITTSFPAQTAERAAHTNWVENTVTNIIEMRMSRNRFVTEYRTNWLDHVSTNVFDVYKTNRLTRNVTNRFIVDAWRTNFTQSYRTNSKELVLTNELVVTFVKTNFVTAYRTNWDHLTLTNQVVVDRIRTNFVEVFNTNWQTVALMKTNRVTQFVTNVAQIELPKAAGVTQASAEKPTAPAVPSATSAESAPSENPVIEVSRTTKPPVNGLVEVELKVRWPADTTDAPPVQQWRIEREGGSFLSFGQEQECLKELPAGNYNVQARLQRDADSPSFLLKGTLAVTIKEAVVQQRTDRSKVAAVSGNGR